MEYALFSFCPNAEDVLPVPTDHPLHLPCFNDALQALTRNSVCSLVLRVIHAGRKCSSLAGVAGKMGQTRCDFAASWRFSCALIAVYHVK